MIGMQPYSSINPYSYYHHCLASGMCKLEVNGLGKVMVKPDTAEAVLGVITENIQLEIAQQENAVKMSSVIQSIIQEGIPSEAIQTQTYNIEPMYDYIDGKQVFRGYRVTHNLRVTIKNVDQVGRVIDSATNAGANTVNSINFTIINSSAYYKEALNFAINDALTKASDIGMKLNVNISKVPFQIIEETYQQGPPIQPFQLQTAVSATPVQPGQIEINAIIKTIFIYSC